MEFIFGDSIAALTETGTGVRVDFGTEPSREFDLVVGADGLHSRTRRLAFGPESRFIHSLHAHLGIFSIPNYLGLDDWQLLQHLGDTTVLVYSTATPTRRRAIIGFKNEELRYDHRDTDAHKRLPAEGLAGIGGEVPRLLKLAAQAPDFYFDTMAQIRMATGRRAGSRWSATPDTCGSPLTGQGSSLALVGGYVPAGELAAAGGEPPGCAATRTRSVIMCGSTSGSRWSAPPTTARSPSWRPRRSTASC